MPKGVVWTSEEDAVLLDLVAKHGKQWGLIASQIPQRTASQVAARWEKCLDPNLHKGPFTPDEDQLIVNFVAQKGPRSWPQIISLLPNRSSKQCRERWFNHLDPTVVKSEWTSQEDRLIFDQVQEHGPRWSVIAKLCPGRSDNAIKNRWNSSISKRVVTDDKGAQTLLPDSSRRKYRPRERPMAASATATPIKPTQPNKKGCLPPPLQIPALPASSTVSPMISFTPFSMPTPTFTGLGDFTGLSPTSPFGGLQTPGTLFGGLTSPTPTAPLVVLPAKSPSEENL
jgi:hypothetical protein